MVTMMQAETETGPSPICLGDYPMRESTATENFRLNVRLAVEYRDTTFSDIAERTSLAKPGLSRLMTGKEDATLTRAAKIADALRIPLSVLISSPADFKEWIRDRSFSLSR
ncbi:MAG: hypothetical protein WBC44_01435 [Planctomycetaceae bacterium]